MAESNLLPEPIKKLMEQISGSGLRYRIMAAYLIINCHDPRKVRVDERYGDPVKSFYRQFLPYDPEIEKFFHTDPLLLLYEEGRRFFAERGMDPLKIVKNNPLNEQEQKCLELLLGDQRIPYARHENYLGLTKSDFAKPLEGSDLKEERQVLEKHSPSLLSGKTKSI